GDRVGGSAGDGHLAIGQGRVDDQEYVGVRGIDFVQKEHAAVLVHLHKPGNVVLELASFSGGNEQAEERTFGHASRHRNEAKRQVKQLGDLLAQVGLAATGRADQQNVLPAGGQAENLLELSVQFFVLGNDLELWLP